MKVDGRKVRNKEWFHMINDDIVSMPDKWEYPWYAACDLAFHTMALSMVDVEFAKQQLSVLLDSVYQHPNGQIPAYEWNFSDVNPPVHAWAALMIYNTEKQQRGEGDVTFLKRTFGKLSTNFTWWVNRKDRFGNNVFEGGFLGLDNISVFDRSAPLPTGGNLEQADGTAWMALFCQNMLENETGLWDEEDGFYYDLRRSPEGHASLLKVRSMVGLLPLCAATITESYQRERIPNTLVDQKNSNRIRTGAITSSSTSIFMGTTEPDSVPAIKLGGPDLSRD